MLIAAAAGGLGNLFTSASYLTFMRQAGGRALKPWVWFILDPLWGSVVGLFVFTVIRGGLIPNSSVGVLNQFVLAAIAGVFGFFSKPLLAGLNSALRDAVKLSGTAGLAKEEGDE